MVKSRPRDTEERIPPTLEGYPVEVEVTGVIRPMEGEAR
jgi:hypothetical protein